MRSRSEVLSHLRRQGVRDLTRSQKTAIIEAEKYVTENKIEELMNELLAQVILNRPKDIKTFLKEQLELQIKLQGDNFYFTRQDFETLFLNYDFFNEGKVPFTMLVQALGLTGVESSDEVLRKKHSKPASQIHIVKDEFVAIMEDEYRERIKKYRAGPNDGDILMEAIASDSFLNDMLIYCDLELVKHSSKEEYGCMKRVVDYIISNPELCVVDQFEKAVSVDLTTVQKLVVMNAVGVEMLERGYFKQSESFLVACQNGKVGLYGEASIEVGSGYNNLALLKRQMEKFEEGRELLLKALKIYQVIHKKDSPACLEIRENLAVLLRSQGKLDEAIEQYEEILKVKKRTLGETSLSTVQSLENLAVVLIKQDRFDEAIERLSRVLEVKKKKVGENSLSYAGTLHNISIALEAKKDIRKALEISKNALKISKNDSLTSSFVRTVENHVKQLELHAAETLDVSQEIQ